MTASHTDPLPGEVDIVDIDNEGLVQDIQGLVGLLSNSLCNAYKNDRSKNDVRRAQSRINRATRLIITRHIGEMMEAKDKFDDKQEEFDILQDEYNDLIRRHNNLRQASRNMVTRLGDENDRLRRQIAVLRIQNQWRQFRLLNLPPIAPPQRIDQVWLLL